MHVQTLSPVLTLAIESNSAIVLIKNQCLSKVGSGKDVRHFDFEFVSSDVEVLVGLPADGEPVTDQMHDDWLHVCQELLGVIPPPEQIRGQRLSLTWLGAEFHELANDVDEETITCYAWAYILQLMGGSIFADKSTRYVHLMFLPFLANMHHTGRYSWGGAYLAWLYRQLCKASKQGVREIAGPLILLQIWAWERFPIVALKLLHLNVN
ncbi:serine/threonine-protein phosphatase 7 long form-like protein [Cucumis melo var. makuwa]|uniref:Serine/threonine-protein phosphatase 7 long form-like protein n=1 Tax=Cucumis melo var. makuwa TaxID=1194695 RepID=A0A5D3CE61_CUCMM|nr:serine/threonine-protein phosphatase 7 long form-like protein [Cucumis melo var. makuwa]